ncbi:MAG TPA: AtpZ/AtpI family protein [Planctomycetaceae bacterium]|jgi:F0F1-type ATP synthase assembly protein I
MEAPNRDRRPPMVVAADLASQVISVCLVMALPAGLGFWGDLHLGTSPLCVVSGAILGLVVGMRQLLRLVGGQRKQKQKEDHQKDKTDES